MKCASRCSRRVAERLAPHWRTAGESTYMNHRSNTCAIVVASVFAVFGLGGCAGNDRVGEQIELRMLEPKALEAYTAERTESAKFLASLTNDGDTSAAEKFQRHGLPLLILSPGGQVPLPEGDCSGRKSLSVGTPTPVGRFVAAVNELIAVGSTRTVA